MRIAPALLMASALGLSGGAAAGNPPTDHRLPTPAGTARLTLPGEGLTPTPLVILLPDALGEEARSEPYVAALAARGMAALVLGFDAEVEGASPGTDPAASAAAAGVAHAWALRQAPLFEAGTIGLLGLGAGGRAALAAAELGPAVALDPGCAGLDLPDWTPVLVLHGLAAPDAAACAGLPEPPAATILGLPSLGHGWDVSPMAAPAGTLLSDPAGEGRRRASPDPVATRLVAEQAAAWLFLQLHGRQGVRP
jgi:dienelactone hydrolase